jgi:hypothetical protein
MQGNDGFQRFARGGFDLLGIEVDETQLAVIAAADALYRPRITALLEADLDAVEPEPRIDLSRPPQ